MKKYVILVACYEYGGGGTDFAKIAKRRVDYLIRQNPTWATDNNVEFVLFDVKAGTISKNTVTSGSRSWAAHGSGFTAIDRSVHYPGGRFVHSANNVMSIVDVYDFLEGIGSSEPGTVFELSFFGHGYSGGPILINSWQRDLYKTGAKHLERDPFDKDGRQKDFNRVNMPKTRWRNIRRAFSEDGYCWLWGCVFNRTALGIYTAMARSKEYKAKRVGSHTDNDVFNLRFSKSYAKKYYKYAPHFFPPDKDGKPVLKFSKTLKDIKQVFKSALLITYAGRFAQDLGVDCRAALLGTYSVFESRSSRVPHPLMIIANGGRNHGYDFRKFATWYHTYLNIPLDPEGRNYGIYEKNSLAVWYREWEEFINTHRAHPVP